MRRNYLFLIGLLIITLASFWGVGRFGFIIYDDWDYVYKNPPVMSGITWKGIVWAFTTMHSSNWHPLTWLSHMLDCQVFGVHPTGPHWVNLGLHAANTLLLFLVLGELTGTCWRSFLVAALFACHPLHVQSVAWISERKDMLSGFFFMLTILCYTKAVTRDGWQVTDPKKKEKGETSTGLRCATPRQDIEHSTFNVQHPPVFAALRPGKTSNVEHSTFNIQRSIGIGRGWYWASVFLFALGLMSKPMLVTLPVILLLLDYWPLKRISEFGVRSAELKNAPQLPGAAKRGEVKRRRLNQLRPSTLNVQLSTLFLEKLPFVVLSLASCLVTVRAQREGGSVIAMTQIDWQARYLHAVLSYSLYLGKLFWPVDLAIFYPYTPTPPDVFVWMFLLPIGLCLFCLWQWRARPWLAVGWFWFVIMMLPVIGLVQVGMQAMADRYAYLPSIGIFIVVAWAMAEFAGRGRSGRVAMGLLGTVLIAGCVLDTRYQLRFWRSNVDLFTRSVTVTPENNFVGYFFLGNSYGEAGDLDNAAKSFSSALAIAPGFKEARMKLGYVYLFQKKYDDAAAQFSEIIREHPDNIFAHEYLAHTLVAEGDYAGAQAEYQTALDLKPDDAELRKALEMNAQKIPASQTLATLDKELKTNATPELHIQIAAMQCILGDYQEALTNGEEALRLSPDSPDGLNNLAWLLATCADVKVRDGARAVKLAQRACELTQNRAAVFLGTLAAAYAEAGRYDEAVATAEKAMALASAAGETELVKRNQELLALYRSHQPYHERPAKVIPAVP